MSGVLNPQSVYSRLQRRFRPALGDGSSVLIGAHAYQTGLRFFSNLVLTRLLVPEVYGVVAIMMSAAYVINQLTDMGLRGYVIRHATAGDELLQTVWTVRAIRNLTLTVIMFFGAPYIAQAYGAPETTAAMRAYAGIMFLEIFASFSFMTTERNRGVVRLTAIEATRGTLTIVVTIALAYFLRSFWAIIIAMYFNTLFTIVCSHSLLKGPPIRLRFKREYFLDLWSYWRIILPSSAITIFITQTDKIILARFFPIAELGRYYLAAAIVETFGALISQHTIRVFFPTFAQADREDPEGAHRFYYAPRWRVTMLFALALGGLFGAADFVTRLLFNDDYLGTEVYIRILIFAPLAQLLAYPAEQALIAKGFLKAALHGTIIKFLWAAIAAPLGYVLFGPLGAITALALSYAATLPFFWWRTRQFGLLRIERELGALGVFAMGVAIGWAIAETVAMLVERGVIPAF